MKQTRVFLLIAALLFSMNTWASNEASSRAQERYRNKTRNWTLTGTAAVAIAGALIYGVVNEQVQHVKSFEPMAGHCPLGFTADDLKGDSSPALLKHLRPMSDGNTITVPSLWAWSNATGLSSRYFQETLEPTVWISGFMTDGNMDERVPVAQANAIEHEPVRTGFYAKDGTGNLELWEELTQEIYGDDETLEKDKLIRRFIAYNKARGTKAETNFMGILNSFGKLEDANRGELDMFVITFGQLVDGKWYLAKSIFARFPEYDLLSLERMESYLDPEKGSLNGQTQFITGKILDTGTALVLVPDHEVYVSDPLSWKGAGVMPGTPIKITGCFSQAALDASAFRVRLETRESSPDGTFPLVATELELIDPEFYEAGFQENPMTKDVWEKIDR